MQLAWRKHYSGPRRFSPGRERSPEHLDREDVAPSEKARSYRDLETISRLPFQHGPLSRVVRELSRRHADRNRPIELLEIGAGTGSVGLRLATMLRRDGLRVRLLSTDLRTEFLPAPGERDGVRVEARKLDALRDPMPDADICVANLLVHHFDADDVVHLLARMRAACRLGGAVFDLDRNAWAFGFIRWTFPLWVRSPITAADALISVQQAFRREELLDMARRAGITGARVRVYLKIRSLLWWRVEAPSSRGP